MTNSPLGVQPLLPKRCESVDEKAASKIIGTIAKSSGTAKKKY